MASLLDSIVDTWIWCSAELRDLFHVADDRRSKEARLYVQARADAMGKHDLALAVHRSSIAVLAIEDFAGSECVIGLADGKGLVRHLSTQRVAYHQALELAAIDLVEETPFSIDAVYLAIERPSAARPGTRYLIIRKDQIDPIFERLISSKVRLSGIFAGPAAGLPFDVSRQCLRRIVPKPIRPRSGRRSCWALSLAAIMLTVVALGQLDYRYHIASDTIDEQVQSLQQRATVIRKRMDRQADDQAALVAAQSTKAQAVSVIKLWGRLTDVLPQTTWLNEFALRDTVVSIDGYSGDAAGLIRLLDESAKFSATRFTSPVVHTPGVEGDHFSIQTNAAL